MKKAYFFVDEFIATIISKEKREKENSEWQKIESELHFVKNIQLHWNSIVSNALENKSVSKKLSKETYPTHIQDQALCVRVSNADEAMLILLHTKSLIKCIKEEYSKHGSKNSHAQLCRFPVKLRPVYHVP